MSDLAPTVPLSVLDLSPVGEGTTGEDALAASIQLAQRAEDLGYTRYWVAEHHSMAGIASSSPAVLLAAVGAHTERIRLGSGGVMLPNHAPLVIAEQFGTLGSLYPGRIDLGLGRAPGSDQLTAAALRRTTDLGADDFPQELGMLAAFLNDDFPDNHPFKRVTAVPHAEQRPAMWLLGSSTYSAQLAGMLGLPFAFAHHFSGQNTLPALAAYRENFNSDGLLGRPYAMITVQTVAADTDEEAARLSLPAALSFLRLRMGQPGRLPTPEAAEAFDWTPEARAFAESRRENQAIGSVETVGRALRELQHATGADEIMTTSQLFDPKDRLRSLELVRGLADDLPSGLAQL